MGRGPWFEGAATENFGPVFFSPLSAGKGLLPRFDRAWPGDDGERAIANLRTADIDNRSVLFQIERDQFVRFAHPNGLGHAGQIFEMLQTYRAFVAGDANGGTSSARQRMRAHAN